MATNPSLKATGREWASLAVLTLPVLLISMDMTVLYFALPFLSADLEPSSTQLLWIMDIYGFLLAGYTTCLIGFPAAQHPEAVYEIALSRVSAVLIGIFCAGVVSDLILP